MQKAKEILTKNIWLVIVILSLPAIRSLLKPGFFGISDDIHVAWLHQFDALIKMGQFPPRFVPDLSNGFGYPLFNYVFPLPFYIAEIFHLLGMSLVSSIKAVFLISVPLSGIFMYKFLREFMDKWFGLAGALLYIYTPYRATDLYIRGAIGEIVAFVFFPLIAWSVLKIINSKKEGSARWIGIGSLSIAGLVMSHNISAYMFAPAVALLVVVYFIFGKRIGVTYFKSLFFMALLGFLGSGFFWIPAIVDSGLMKYSTVFDFQNHYPTLKQLVKPYFGYGASVAGPYDGMSFYLGAFNILAMLIGGGVAVRKWKKFTGSQKTMLVWAGAIFLASIFMMNFRSTFLWKNLPLLPYFQFPWRLLMMTTFVTPVMLVGLSRLGYNKAIALLVGVGAIFLNYNNFVPQDFLDREDHYFINRYIPYPQASEEYKLTQEEYLRLPVGTLERPDMLYPRATSNGNEIGKITEHNRLEATLEVESEVPVSINYNKYYFPGWVVKVDGESAKLGAGEPHGQIVFEVPSGKHTVDVTFGETPLKMALDVISLMVIGLSVILTLRKSDKKR